MYTFSCSILVSKVFVYLQCDTANIFTSSHAYLYTQTAIQLPSNYKSILTDISASRQSVHTQSYSQLETAFQCHSVCAISLYSITVGVHKCSSPPSHRHSGQSAHRLNTPSKESQHSQKQSQQWHYCNNNNKYLTTKKTVTTVMTL